MEGFVLAPQLTSLGTLGKPLSLWGLSFLMCKIVILMPDYRTVIVARGNIG